MIMRLIVTFKVVTGITREVRIESFE